MNNMRRCKWILFVGFSFCQAMGSAQEQSILSVDKIMQGEKWIGVSPTNIHWDTGSRSLYFQWTPRPQEKSESYALHVDEQNPVKAADSLSRLVGRPAYTRDRGAMVYEWGGDIVWRDLHTGKERDITHTPEQEQDPFFSLQEEQVVFRRQDNFYAISLAHGGINQLTNFHLAEKSEQKEMSQQDKNLMEKQLRVFEILREREAVRREQGKSQEEARSVYPKDILIQPGERISDLNISPDLRFVLYTIESNPQPNRTIVVPDYVANSGYTEMIPGRSKVGGSEPTYTTHLYDRQGDTIYTISTGDIPGIRDIPAFLNDYPALLAEQKKAGADRSIQITHGWWSPDAKGLVLEVMAQDHKDRWLMRVDLLNGKLSLLDRQHDEAWVAGPGIAGKGVSGGWISNGIFYFQSEESGHSHIYTVDIRNGAKKQLTKGNYEVQTLQLSLDKRYFYFTANKEHPGKTNFYRMAVTGGEPQRMTSLEGGNEFYLSPDEKWLAIRHSTIIEPWELYLQKNEPGASIKQITHSTTDEFRNYPWRIPETVVFKNRYGKDVYAHVFQPKGVNQLHPAVVFVHSNGYLQNVHDGWSYHYREYLFNNLLVDQGYTVINIDYTGSAGYGRDVRTGIYRHMGGKDLTDLVDGVHLLVDKYQVDPQRVGLYGGSYGGFLTLMALFTEQEAFAAGAALRSVTDWSNYNHRYTSNILNNPALDPEAYRKSSPLFFAEGLKGHLLMTHGIVDVNVNFQDIVLVTQKLIELGKDNWELAVYPKEDHDFVDAVSWVDQYKRILKLFNQTLNP